MQLTNKIMQLKPSVTKEDFDNGVIVLQDDSNGKGPYIKSWNHSTETRPTDEELENL